VIESSPGSASSPFSDAGSEPPLNEMALAGQVRSFAAARRALWCPPVAGVAQLVEHKLPKLGVEGSNPFSRSR
jgi:hypothetical protein